MSLVFVLSIAYQVLASYLTSPSGLKYPNPGHYPEQIGPGSFNCSDNANCYWEFPGNVSVSGEIHASGDILMQDVVIKGDGSISTNLNADKLDGYDASDLLAAGGGGRGEYRIYYDCKAVCKGGGSCKLASAGLYYPSVSVPPCPPGWEEVYYRDGLNDPGYTYYPGFHLISDGRLTCSSCTRTGACYVDIIDGSGTIIYRKYGCRASGYVSATKVNCGYRICKKV